MEFVEITEENADEFSGFVDTDVSCNLGRCFFFGIGVVGDDDNPVGALVYELINYDSDEDTTSRIHSFAASDEEAAESLMAAYGEAVNAKDVTLSYYEMGDENADRYLGSRGFTSGRGESPDIVVTVGELKKMADLLSGKKLPPYVQSVSKISLMQYRSFLKTCLIKERFGILEDLGYLPMSWFERDVSSCSMADDKVDGVLLIRRLPSQTLEPCLFAAFGIDYQKNLGIIMLSSVQKVVEQYPEDTKVVIRRHNKNVKNLTDKFFPGKKGEEVYIGKRAEG